MVNVMASLHYPTFLIHNSQKINKPFLSSATHISFPILIHPNSNMTGRNSTAVIILISIFSLACCIQAQEHLVLYLRWPGGLCYKDGDCCFHTLPLQDEFLIEFLARSNGTGAVPQCSVTRFFYNELLGQPLLDNLKKYWPSLGCPSDDGFRDWQNMWDSNGVCSGLSQADYFTKALALRTSAKLLSHLADKGIKPSLDVSYNLADVESAINQGLGLQSGAVLHCGSVKNSIVRNIRLCVDSTGTKFINCPQPITSVCAATVKFLTVPQVIEAVTETSREDEL